MQKAQIDNYFNKENRIKCPNRIEKELTSREKWGRIALLESIRIRPKNWRTGLIDPYYSIQQRTRRKRRVFCCLWGNIRIFPKGVRKKRKRLYA